MLGLLTIAGIPTTIGVAQAISEQKKQNRAVNDEEWMQKFNLTAFCASAGGGPGSAPEAEKNPLHGKTVVLRDDKASPTDSC